MEGDASDSFPDELKSESKRLTRRLPSYLVASDAKAEDACQVVLRIRGVGHLAETSS